MALRAAQSEAAQRVGAVLVESGLLTSRTRPRGRGSRGVETRDRKVNRVPVDHGRAMVTDGFVELGVDNVNMQVHSQQEMAHMMGTRRFRK